MVKNIHHIESILGEKMLAKLRFLGIMLSSNKNYIEKRMMIHLPVR